MEEERKPIPRKRQVAASLSGPSVLEPYLEPVSLLMWKQHWFWRRAHTPSLARAFFKLGALPQSKSQAAPEGC